MLKLSIALSMFAALSLAGCGYNTFQSNDEQVKASWSEVINQYQRRADLVPNLVNTVKGEAKFEQDTLTKVIEARSKATSIEATPELVNDPAAFQKFQRVWDTRHNNGLLIYLLLADRAVEIVADRGIHAKVGAAEWLKVCRRMEAAFAQSDYESGTVGGVEAIARHLAAHFPARGSGINELPDEAVVL